MYNQQKGDNIKTLLRIIIISILLLTYNSQAQNTTNPNQTLKERISKIKKFTKNRLKHKHKKRKKKRKKIFKKHKLSKIKKSIKKKKQK